MSVVEAPTATPERAGQEAALPDKIVVKFSGSVSLDRDDPRDRELFRALSLGGDATLQIEGRVSKRAASQLFDREGEPVGVKVETSVGVHTVYRPTD